MKLAKAASSILIFAAIVSILCVVTPAAASRAPSAPGLFDLTEIVREAGPSVVGIVVKLSRISVDYYESSDNIVLGSGVIYRQNGYIITSYHVIENSESIFAILSNRKVYEAKVIGADEASDLALIKIDKGMLKAVEFADSSKVEVGTPVIALGTPVDFELHDSVGFGIVSGVNRENAGFGDYRFLQTDAVVNPGNSGGPLMDMAGRVLGIIEGGYSDYPGITFCIPSRTVMYIADQLMANGRVNRPYIGASLVQSLMADYGLPGGRGLFFGEIAADGPAALAGIAEDDILLSVDGAPVNSLADFSETLIPYRPGDEAEFGLLRGGREINVRVTFDEEP